jgi:hypothetical protein
MAESILRGLMTCPLTKLPMSNPTTLSDGWAYDATSILDFFSEHYDKDLNIFTSNPCSPVTGALLYPSVLINNHTVGSIHLALIKGRSADEILSVILRCPLARENPGMMYNPVIASDGITYDLKGLDRLFSLGQGPVMSLAKPAEPLDPSILIPNIPFQVAIMGYASLLKNQPKVCEVCFKAGASYRCGKCIDQKATHGHKGPRYCSTECQRYDWSTHKIKFH